MPSECPLSVKTRIINSGINDKKTCAVTQNIRYPEFCIKQSAADDKNAAELAKTMNKFYADAANRLSKYASSRMMKKALKIPENQRIQKPCGVCMNYNISFADEKYISVVADVSSFDGKVSGAKRVSHVWSIEKRGVVPAKHFVNTSGEQAKKIKAEVENTVIRNMKNPFFGYYGDAVKSARKNFRFENFYLVPKGGAFFIDAGILANAKYGPAVFVAELDKARET